MSLKSEFLQSVVRKVIHELHRLVDYEEEIFEEQNEEVLQKQDLNTNKIEDKILTTDSKNHEKAHRIMWPKCIYSEQEPCLSSEGFFTPCCWFDDEALRISSADNDASRKVWSDGSTMF